MTERAPYVPSGREIERREEVARHGWRNAGKPEPGYFAIRLPPADPKSPRRVGKAPEVGARIEHGPTRDPENRQPLDRSWLWRVTINGEEDPNPLPTPGERVWRVWHHGRRIDRAEYDFLIADRAWARRYAPDSPEANPREAVDLAKRPPVF